ncbi:hypothetical protein [Microbacterium testaceum]|uniref:hypothetical protein n=1 Tax=Microbacterium testaceum TaxID=2033 RepID=UPI000A406736|nr:hypothetical protein [Microbacterium testaceum]
MVASSPLDRRKADDRRRRLLFAWAVTFPAWVIVFVVVGVFMGDVVGGLRTGALFGAVMGGLGSIPTGRGGGSVSSSNYVDSGFASDASCGDNGGGGDGSHC